MNLRINILIIIPTLFLVVFDISSNNANAEQVLDITCLKMPILVINYNIPSKVEGSGSGFFFDDKKNLYLVTARHVLFNINSKENSLITNNVKLIAYPMDSNERFDMSLDLVTLNKTGNIKYDVARDVVAVRIFNYTQLKASPGITIESDFKSKYIAVNASSYWTYEKTYISNSVFIFGYPTSLGLEEHPQFDLLKPLIRKGIIAGKNDQKKIIIIDCPSYPGNSGGPALMINEEADKTEFRVIGVVVEFVPLVEKWTSSIYRYQNQTLYNSGYTIIEPMDSILDIVASFQ